MSIERAAEVIWNSANLHHRDADGCRKRLLDLLDAKDDGYAEPGDSSSVWLGRWNGDPAELEEGRAIADRLLNGDPQ